jgi:hypothetical protein
MIRSWQDIPGWFDFQDVYDQAVSEAQPGDTLIEVGCYLGKSTAYMGQKIKDSCKRLTFYAVDSWDEITYGNWAGYLQSTSDKPSPMPSDDLLRHRRLYDAFLYAIGQCGLIPGFQAGSDVNAVRYTSLQAAAMFRNNRMSFIFIDANHSYEAVLADIKAWKPLVKPGGLLAGHDLCSQWPGVERAVREVFGDGFEKRRNSWVVRI